MPEFPEDAPASRFALTGGLITQGNLETMRPLKDYYSTIGRLLAAADGPHLIELVE